MDGQRNLTPNPFETPFDEADEKPGEWVDWESEDDDNDDEDVYDEDEDEDGESPVIPMDLASITPIEPLHIRHSDSKKPTEPMMTTATTITTHPAATRTTSTTRSSVHRPRRPKSRARQKAQNAQAGIRVITDMAKFRRQQQHQIQQAPQQRQLPVSDFNGRPGKFVDAAALRALEGRPSDSSVGSWHWRRRRENSNTANNTKKDSPVHPSIVEQDLSPNDRPIVIGFSLPEDDLVGRALTPQTADAETPAELSRHAVQDSPQPQTQQLQKRQQPQLLTVGQLPPPQTTQLRSVWSPDTDDGTPLSASIPRAASSVYSQAGLVTGQGEVPPVPVVPLSYREAGGAPVESSSAKLRVKSTVTDQDDDGVYDDDVGTPVTLFEEDGGSPSCYRRQSRARGHGRSLAVTINTVNTQSGWWDHVRTPFAENQSSPMFSARTVSPRSVSPMTPGFTRTPDEASSNTLAVPSAPTAPAGPAVPAPYTDPVAAENPVPIARASPIPEAPAVPAAPAPAPLGVRVAHEINQVQETSTTRATPVVQTETTPAIPTTTTVVAEATVNVTAAAPPIPTAPVAPVVAPAAPSEPNVVVVVVPAPGASEVAVMPHIATQVASPPHQDDSEWWRVIAGSTLRIAEPHQTGLGISTVASTDTDTRAQNDRSIPANTHSESLVHNERSTTVSSSRSVVATNSAPEARERNANPALEDPPPYESPSLSNRNVRYQAVLPPGHPVQGRLPPSPGPVSPGLAYTMTSQGAIHMSDVPLTPPAGHTPGTYRVMPRPEQQQRAVNILPSVEIMAKRKQQHKLYKNEETDVEKKKKKKGLLWCLALIFCCCFLREKDKTKDPDDPDDPKDPNDKKKKRRRRLKLYLTLLFTVLSVVLAVVLAVELTKKHVSTPEYTFWLNLTDYPPMPTGVTTVVGAENIENVDSCVNPTTMWSCSLAKEKQTDNEPFAADELTFILDIQYDNSSGQLWKVSAGPTPTPETGTGTVTVTVAATTTTQAYDSGFTPDPTPPSFQEMWFLGNTTDGVVSDNKAGEATPFYISFLSSVNSSVVGPNMVTKRGLRRRSSESSTESSTGSSVESNTESSTESTTKSSTTKSSTTKSSTTNTASTTSTSTSSSSTKSSSSSSSGSSSSKIKSTSTTASSSTSTTSTTATTTEYPAPATNTDGTGAAAVLYPLPKQQPVRLFDRGLATEHYGFYSYFTKTIYVKTITASTTNVDDEDGGALESEADYIVTYLQTRFLVQIWTRADNTTTQLLGASGSKHTNSTQPGTFPYPITFTEDLHGGDFSTKGNFARVVEDSRIINTNASLIIADLTYNGTLINHSSNPSFGGSDGGTGGCKCMWSNYATT